MRDLQHVRILEEICDIVADDMNARKIELTERSFLLNEIAEVEPLERRELLRNHLFSTVLNLLIGVQDQVRSLGAAFNIGASVTPFILGRTILEYSFKITYISDPQISPTERIKRFLRLYYTDIQQFDKLPDDLRSSSGKELATERKRQAAAWYQEITNKNLGGVGSEEILDEVWKSGLQAWKSKASEENVIYEKGYRIGSAIVHGHGWAIGHYCLETQVVGDSYITTPSLKEETIRDLLLIAAGCLMYSYGFVTQLMDMLPVGIMNKLEGKIAEIRYE